MGIEPICFIGNFAAIFEPIIFDGGGVLLGVPRREK